MPHINLKEAQQHITETLRPWLAGCPNKHPVSRYGTHKFGTGYQGASENNPATILESDWNLLFLWWTQMKLDKTFRRSTVQSLTGGPGVWDLCCECTSCPPVASKPKPAQPNFVYHLKKVKKTPPKLVLIQASSNNVAPGDTDSLELDIQIEYPGKSFATTLDQDGRYRLTLPEGVTETNCRFGFQGHEPALFKTGMKGLLPGGRYMVLITAVWP